MPENIICAAIIETRQASNPHTIGALNVTEWNTHEDASHQLQIDKIMQLIYRS